MKAIALLVICSFASTWLLRCFTNSVPHTAAKVDVPPPAVNEKIKGVTFVAPPIPFPADPFMPIKATASTWIAVIPYAFTMQGQASLHYNNHKNQWWGERPEGVMETIKQAKTNHLHVMLKPQVYIPGSWTGSLQYTNEADWADWEKDYTDYILTMADIAQSHEVELFCVGTEFRTSIAQRPAYWSELIEKVRQVYKGKITYSANWDDWDKVPFWSALDYIGTGGYYPLVQADTPSVHALVQAWQPIATQLKTFSTQQKKPVIFTEYGYLSVNNCGWRNWELESNIFTAKTNQQAQANCYEALFTVFSKETWWAGGFLWKWFPNGQGHEGYPEKDYTPQGKLAEKVLTKWNQ